MTKDLKKPLIFGSLLAVLSVQMTSAQEVGYTMLDTVDVTNNAGLAFVMISVGFFVVGAIIVIKVISDM